MIEYEFELPKIPELRNNYIKLLCKYYPNVKCAVVTEDNEVISTKIDDELLQIRNLSNVKLTTEPIPDDFACIRALPERDPTFFVHSSESKAPKIRVSKKIKKLRDFLDELLKDKSKAKLPISYVIFEMTSYLFGDVLSALRYIRSTNLVTRCHIEYQKEKIILVLEDSQVLGITKSKITWAKLPIFDVEEGFSSSILSDVWFSKELHFQFNWWYDKLIKSNYNTWDEPIFPKDYSWTLIVKNF
jgi:hypothetical protein